MGKIFVLTLCSSVVPLWLCKPRRPRHQSSTQLRPEVPPHQNVASWTNTTSPTCEEKNVYWVLIHFTQRRRHEYLQTCKGLEGDSIALSGHCAFHGFPWHNHLTDATPCGAVVQTNVCAASNHMEHHICCREYTIYGMDYIGTLL